MFLDKEANRGRVPPDAYNPFDYLTEIDRHADELSSTPQNWMPWNYRELLDAANPLPAVSQ
jgi:hypothetical protein